MCRYSGRNHFSFQCRQLLRQDAVHLHESGRHVPEHSDKVMFLIEQKFDSVNACLLKGVGIYFPQFIKHEKDPVLFFVVFFLTWHFTQVCRFVVQKK